MVVVTGRRRVAPGAGGLPGPIRGIDPLRRPEFYRIAD
ncbi:hypothetical protein L810_0049 [Burkholderia sp. AU4i]|nr:hypothetical protein L810_0049 [Burkholderia sp. AU4i]